MLGIVAGLIVSRLNPVFPYKNFLRTRVGQVFTRRVPALLQCFRESTF